MNYKTKFFFYFIIFYKDFNQLTRNKKYIPLDNSIKKEKKNVFKQSMTMNYSINDEDIPKSHAIPNKFNLVIEENTNGLNTKILEKNYSPITLMTLFQAETVKKSSMEYIEQYLKQLSPM